MKNKKKEKCFNKKLLFIPGMGLGILALSLYFNKSIEQPIIADSSNPVISQETITPPKEDVPSNDDLEMEEKPYTEEIKTPTPDENEIIQNYEHNTNDSSYDAVELRERLKTYNYSNNGEKLVFLTFDDGSHPINTPKVLDILDKEDVKATFFVNGKAIVNGGQTSKDILKRTYEEGHAIGNHSYSHDYKYLYPNRTLNLNNFKSDFAKTDELLKEILGEDFSTRVIRCPGGEMSWKGMSVLEKEYDKVSIDWNALTKDAEGKPKVASQLVEECINTSANKDIVVLLMHDIKSETAKALPDIIKHFKENGYEFKTIV